MDLGLNGAAVCISGGTKGMGYATALAFARERARVVVTGRDRIRLDHTVARLLEAGAPDAFGVRCELPRLDEIEALFQTIERRWGELNTLVNMAGPTEGSHFDREFAETTDESWEYFFQMGIMSVVRCTRLAIPLMRKAGWGRVINVSSQSARIAGSRECGYMTVKAGLNALSKNVAWTYAKEDILVNSITPGAVATEAMTERMVSTGAVAQGYDPQDLVSVGRFIAEYVGPRARGIIGRAGLPEEIAPQIVLLGSKLSSFIVGSNVAIDGGSDFS